MTRGSGASGRDLFVDTPIDFEELSQGAALVEVGSTPVRIASIPHLIRMKQIAGREQDRADIRMLEEIERRRGLLRD